jgi:hypothetical protein
MPQSLLPRYRDAIARYPAAAGTVAHKPAALPDDLLIRRDGPLSIYYAPFEYANPNAKVVLLGITPGLTQADNALRIARAEIEAGSSDDVILRKARQGAGFSGSMRAPLIAMLDTVGLNAYLGLDSCATLFDEHRDWLQSMSAIVYPTFVNGKNYGGSNPTLTSHPALQELMTSHLAPMLEALQDAVIVPLGPKPEAAIGWVAVHHGVRPPLVLRGMPHPSGSNAERIAYFLGRKSRENLSNKTNPDKYDQAKALMKALLKQ